MAADQLASAGASVRPRQVDAARYIRHDRFRIPLDHPFALRFYIDNLLTAQSRGGVLRAAVARALAPIGCAGAVLDLKSTEQPVRGTPIALSTGGGDARVRRLCSILREAGVIEDTATSVITLDDHSHSDRGKIVMFILRAAAKEPFAVVKASARAEHSATLTREHDILCMLRERLGEQLAATLPVPLAAMTYDDETVVAEAYMGGASMYLAMRNDLLPRRLVGEHFRLALGWLVRFQKETQVGEGMFGDHDAVELATQPLREYERLCSPSTDERVFIAAVVEKAEALKGERVPVVASHGDFWAGNLVIRAGNLGVFDWEKFSDRNSPFDDLLMFTTSYGLNYPWRLGLYAEPTVAFNATYSGQGWMARLVQSHLLGYCAAIGVSPMLIEVFLPIFLAKLALEECAPLDDMASSSGEGHSVGAAMRSPRLERSKWRGLFQEYVRMDAKRTTLWHAQK